MNFSITDIVIIIPVIIFSLAFHEAMHAFTAHWLGDTTARDMGRLTLNPLKHIDPYTTVLLPVITFILFRVPFLAAKPVPFNPDRVKYDEYGAALIGVSGPLSNLLLAALAAIPLRFAGPGNASSIFLIIAEINIFLFVFNMIPFPPLDGSRLLYAFAPESVQRVMYQIESLGFIPFLVIFILLLPFIGPVITVIATKILHILAGSAYSV